MQRGCKRNRRYKADDPDPHELHRKVAVGPRPTVARPAALELQVRQSPFQTVPDGGQRTNKADDSTRGHRAGADVKDVGVADLIWRHVLDQAGRLRRERCAELFAEELDQWDEHQVGKHSAAAHDRSDPRSDDVTNAK